MKARNGTVYVILNKNGDICSIHVDRATAEEKVNRWNSEWFEFPDSDPDAPYSVSTWGLS